MTRNLAALPLLVFLAACSTEHAPPISQGTGGTHGTGGSGGGGAHFDGGVVSSQLGPVEVVDIPAGGPCVAPAAPAVTLSTAPELGTTFARTGAVGTRRYAFGSDGNVLMTFNADGSSPSPLVFGASAVAATDTIATLVLGFGSVSVAFYDASAAALGPGVSVDTATADAPSIASGSQGVLAVYRAQGAIHGRLVKNGTLAGSFDMAGGSGGDGACQTAALADDQGFTVLYNRHQADGTTRTTWARIEVDGAVALAKTVLTSQGPHQLFDLASWSTGSVALFSEGDPGATTVLLFLDEFGNVRLPARRLLGVSLPLGLAVNGTTTLVAALLDNGRAAVRAIDQTGTPLAPFVCVDDDLAPDGGFYAQAGVAAQGAGWGIVSRMTDLSAAYRVTNLAATGVP